MTPVPTHRHSRTRPRSRWLLLLLLILWVLLLLLLLISYPHYVVTPTIYILAHFYPSFTHHTSRRRSRYFCFGNFVYRFPLACKSQDCWKMRCLQYTNTRNTSNYPQSASPIHTCVIVSFIWYYDLSQVPLDGGWRHDIGPTQLSTKALGLFFLWIQRYILTV
jgi:hypothetical protein